MSDSLRPHGLQPTRLLCPWNSPDENIGVGSHSLLPGIFPTQESNPTLPTMQASEPAEKLIPRSLNPGPTGSDGEESACSVGDPSSIPGSGRPPGEGIGYSLQYSWASLVTQTVNNLPTMLGTWVQSLDPLEKRMASHSSNLAWRIPWTEEPSGLQSMGLQRFRHN